MNLYIRISIRDNSSRLSGHITTIFITDRWFMQTASEGVRVVLVLAVPIEQSASDSSFLMKNNIGIED